MPGKRFGRDALATSANAITVARLLLSVPMVILIAGEHKSNWPVFVVWVCLALSDRLDGWIARGEGQTDAGAFLDPLADKVLVLGALIMLTANARLPWLPVILIVVREVAITALRSISHRSMPARRLGKAKTISQLIAVSFVLFPPTAKYHSLSVATIWLAAGLTIISGLDLWRSIHQAP